MFFFFKSLYLVSFRLHSLPQYRNSTDIDIKPSQGIKPKDPTIKGMELVICTQLYSIQCANIIEQQATGLLRPVVEQSTMCTRMQLQEELDDSLLVC